MGRVAYYPTVVRDGFIVRNVSRVPGFVILQRSLPGAGGHVKHCQIPPGE